MGGGQFLSLLHATSRYSLVKPSTSRPFFNNPTKNYGQASNNGNRGRLMEERAPSTAEEFQRVAEEKTKKTSDHQNFDKSYDAASEEANKVGSVKNRLKEH